MKKKKLSVIGMALLLVAAIGGLAWGQQAQPPVADSLNFLINLVIKQTSEKFDIVLFQSKALSGAITNSELSFRLNSGQTVRHKTREIAALILEAGQGSVVLASGTRLAGQLITPLEVALAGTEAATVSLAPESLGVVVLKGQLKQLNTSEFQELLRRLQTLVTKSDIIVLASSGVLAGTVTNPVFQINDLYFNKETIAEIMFGLPDKLRASSGQIVTGTIRNPAVTFELTDKQNRFTFAKSLLVRVLFVDREVTFSPSGHGGVHYFTKDD